MFSFKKYRVIFIIGTMMVALSTKLLAQERPGHAVILIYHHISDTAPAITSTPVARFEEQLRYIEDNQFQVWSLKKIIDHLQNNQTIPDKVVAITFDDGYRSVYTEAFPRLKARGWPFTIFVSTEAIDNAYKSHCTWDELKTMANNGATIANHSTTHAHLARQLDNETTRQWQQRIKQELTNAQTRIKTMIGKADRFFAYPYGEYSPPLKQLIQQLGYIGFGQQSGAIGKNSDFSALPRFPIAGRYNELNDFAVKLHSLPLPVTAATGPANPLPHRIEKPSLTLSLNMTAAQLKQLQCYGNGERLLIEPLSDQTVRISTASAIPIGRSRFNCTVAAGNGRFYWYSKPWIRLKANGEWLLD